MLRRALRAATASVPGAVHLNVPVNVLTDETAAPPKQAKVAAIPRTHLPPGIVTTIADALSQVQHPVVLAGLGAKLSGAGAALTELAERTGALVATTIKGKGVFPEDHALSVGCIGPFGGTPKAHATVLSERVDFLLVLGSSMGELATLGWDQRLVANRRVCQIDLNPLHIGRTLPVDIPAVADVRAAVEDLVTCLPERVLTPCVNTSWVERRTDCSMLSGSTVVRLLSEICPDDVLLYVDNGNCLGWVGEQYVARLSGSIYCSLNTGCIGYATPAAIGGKFAKPGRPVVALTGDAAFAMTGMDIHTAVEYELPITWVVLNNGGNGMVSCIQNMLFERSSGAMYDNTIDFATIARGLRVSSSTVTSADEFTIALKTALIAGKPHLIDAWVDPCEVPWGLRARADRLRGLDSGLRAEQQVR
ncbi:thiamine pyrophosphate-binding protein [Kibdelosporangium aridum]